MRHAYRPPPAAADGPPPPGGWPWPPAAAAPPNHIRGGAGDRQVPVPAAAPMPVVSGRAAVVGWQGPTPAQLRTVAPAPLPPAPVPTAVPAVVAWPAHAAGAVAGSSQRLLADDYFRLCHHHRSGVLRVHPRIAGVGLASALLGELVWHGKVVWQGGRVVCCDRTPPATAVAHRVLEQILHEPDTLPIGDWLNFVALQAHEQVAQRLLDAGEVVRVQRRRRLHRYAVDEPTDPDSWEWRRVFIADSLIRRRVMPPPDVYLAGLAKVTTLLGDVVTHHDGVVFLDHLLPGLPAAVRELLAATAAVIEAHVVTAH